MIYIASPYTHPDPAVRQRRYEEVAAYAARCIATGEIVFSPIAYGHPLAALEDLPTSAGFWEKFNHGVLRRADRLRVLKMRGWYESVGVNRERELAELAHIPIDYVEMGQ